MVSACLSCLLTAAPKTGSVARGQAMFEINELYSFLATLFWLPLLASLTSSTRPPVGDSAGRDGDPPSASEASWPLTGTTKGDDDEPSRRRSSASESSNEEEAVIHGIGESSGLAAGEAEPETRVMGLYPPIDAVVGA